MPYKFYFPDASNHLLFATVRIETEQDDGDGIGTGFFFNYRAPGESVDFVMLVTNKHVVDGATRATIRLHRAKRGTDDRGQFVENVGPPVVVSIPDVRSLFIDHPDSAIDLCAAPWPAIQKYVTDPSVFFECVHASWIISSETLSRMSNTHPVQMVGYSYGLADEHNNFPLIRHGFTSLQPSIDYEGKPETVIDIATYPGSSGSPVFVLDNAYFGSVPCFLAVLYAGPDIGATGKIVPRPIPLRLSGSTFDTLHFGFAIKSTAVLDLGRTITGKTVYPREHYLLKP
jgi:hypothetical protein